MDNPLISVIVPIYKVEPYLRRCLDSIVNQTYTNLEIILVDDGSPDGCPAISDEYAAKDSRIIVIHKENGGLSDARNAGLDICKGEYISFVDSDDWVEPDYIELLFNAIKAEQNSISVCNHIQFDKKGTVYSSEFLEKEVLSSNDALSILIKKAPIQFILSWGKLFPKKIFDKIQFPVGKVHEDQYTSYKTFFFAKKIFCINKHLYHYRKRCDSIMGTLEEINYKSIQLEQINFLKKNKLIDLANYIAIPLCWSALKDYYESSKTGALSESKQKKSVFKDYVKQLSIQTTKIHHLFLLSVFKKIPNFYVFLKKHLNP